MAQAVPMTRLMSVVFLEERERHANRIGDLICSAFGAVERAMNYSLRPPDYVPLDMFWNKRSYYKRPELRITLSWKDLDEPLETERPIVF